MIVWKTLRIPVLAVTAVGVLLALGKAILTPEPFERTAKPFVFPQTVPLQGWQPVANQPLTDPPGHLYHYRQRDRDLKVEMRYADKEGRTANFFREHDPNPPASASKTVLIRQQSTGAYSLTVEQQRAYLRACINPLAPSAITYDQYIQGRHRADLHPSRYLPWALGLIPFRDRRCLFAQLSMPVSGSSPEATYELLEAAWLPWSQWWQPRFP